MEGKQQGVGWGQGVGLGMGTQEVGQEGEAWAAVAAVGLVEEGTVVCRPSCLLCLLMPQNQGCKPCTLRLQCYRQGRSRLIRTPYCRRQQR